MSETQSRVAQRGNIDEETNVTNIVRGISLNTVEENLAQTYSHGWLGPSNKLQVRSPEILNS